MFLSIARWSALSALLFLGATLSPSLLHGQQSAAVHRGSMPAPEWTAVANPLLVNTAAQARNAETYILLTGAGSAPVIDSSLPLFHPLLAPFGTTLPTPASPLALTMAPKQDDGVHVGANLALMGVGAAALVTGLILDSDAGTIIAVGGGVVGLIGFYRWLK